MKLEPGDQLQLSDGNTYTYLFPMPLRGEEYMIFSCKESEDAFRLGKITKEGEEEKITFVFDKDLLQEAYDYASAHANEL